jgi:hypothetical protein
VDVKKAIGVFVACLLFAGVLVLGSCQRIDEPIIITSVEVDRSTVTDVVLAGTFDVTSLFLVITMSDGATGRVSVNPRMIDDADLDLLDIPGTHTITITYRGFRTSFDLTVMESALSVTQMTLYRLATESGLIDMTYEEWLSSIRGDDGRGIASVTIDDSGNLRITLTDGTVTDLGKVDGDDGTGVIDAYVEEDGDLYLVLSDGNVVHAGNLTPEETFTDGVIASISDNTIAFRAKSFPEPGFDLMTTARLASANTGLFNYMSIGKTPSDAPPESLSMTLIKAAGDDSCPANFNGSYVGANHAPSFGQSFRMNGHGKTEEDIGSIWKGTSHPDVDYVLWRVPDDDTLWFAPMTDGLMTTGGPLSGKPLINGETLTHDSGATHPEDITVNAIINNAQQLHPVANHITKRLVVDGETVPLDENGIHHASHIVFVETYDIVYTPAAIRYLIDHVGENTNMSAADDAINEAYMSVSITYDFQDNGAVVQTMSYDIRKTITLGNFGFVQSSDFNVTDHYLYVPYTDFDDVHYHAPGISIDFPQDTWHDSELPPTSYFQLESADPVYAINLGYDVEYGTARPEIRNGMLTSAAFFYTSYKMYPRLVNKGTLVDGDRLEAVAYRVLSYGFHEDFTVLNWYRLNDAYIVQIGAHKDVDTYLDLPLEMDGMGIDVIRKTEGTIINATLVTGGRIRIRMTGSSNHAILKLTPL